MERGTSASGSDLTQIMPHWEILRSCLRVHTPERTRVEGWTLWMKTLLPELKTGGEIISFKWRNPPPTNPLTHPPMLVGASLNESHQWAVWTNKQSRQPDWLLSNISSVHSDTDLQQHPKKIDTHLLSVVCWFSVSIMLKPSGNYLCFFCSLSL